MRFAIVISFDADAMEPAVHARNVVETMVDGGHPLNVVWLCRSCHLEAHRARA